VIGRAALELDNNSAARFLRQAWQKKRHRRWLAVNPPRLRLQNIDVLRPGAARRMLTIVGRIFFGDFRLVAAGQRWLRLPSVHEAPLCRSQSTPWYCVINGSPTQSRIKPYLP
jgi:hypothetical protein